MNNPHNLNHDERGITPIRNFGKGINHSMSKDKRVTKRERNRANGENRAALHSQKAGRAMPDRAVTQTAIDAISGHA